MPGPAATDIAVRPVLAAMSTTWRRHSSVQVRGLVACNSGPVVCSATARRQLKPCLEGSTEAMEDHPRPHVVEVHRRLVGKADEQQPG